jgi:3-deoxy-manno-octulosonate cytidylyltransferase (CMP-KDO synthetase)
LKTLFRVVIPARHASTRLPGKPLLLLAGEPMILHVHRLALRSGAAEVIIATDDERIRSVCSAAGAAVEMTAEKHASGTDRIAEVALRHSWADDDIVVNVQGDVPLRAAKLIGQGGAQRPGSAGGSLAKQPKPGSGGGE